MTTIDLRTDREGRPALHLTFPGWERWMVGRAACTIPVGEITTVRVEEDWTSEVLGLRSGLVVSGVIKVARFTHPDGTRRLVAMRRGLPLLRIRIADREFDEALISTPDAATLHARLLELVDQEAA